MAVTLPTTTTSAWATRRGIGSGAIRLPKAGAEQARSDSPASPSHRVRYMRSLLKCCRPVAARLEGAVAIEQQGGGLEAVVGRLGLQAGHRLGRQPGVLLYLGHLVVEASCLLVNDVVVGGGRVDVLLGVLLEEQQHFLALL